MPLTDGWLAFFDIFLPNYQKAIEQRDVGYRALYEIVVLLTQGTERFKYVPGVPIYRN